jgi:type IV pilus assembly protein PilM
LRVPLVYKDAPLMGFDIGNRSVKVVQLKPDGKKVQGYGVAEFPADAVVEGIIADPEAMAKAIKPMLSKPAAGSLNAKRAIISVPAAKVFIRILQLPPMDKSDLDQAVRFEAEQYVPVPANDLYIDYETFEANSHQEGEEPHINVMMVAAPRSIVDTYIKLFDALNLEIEAIDTSLGALTRAITRSSGQDKTLLVMDIGSKAVDLALFNKKVVSLTGTVTAGGDELTLTLVKALGIQPDQANEIKYKFGIGPSGLQPKILAALEPKLKALVTEIKRVVKYQNERGGQDEAVQAIVLAGGGANMPGLGEYLSQQTGIPVSIGNPWSILKVSPLPQPSQLEAPMYATAIGLALRGSGS